MGDEQATSIEGILSGIAVFIVILLTCFFWNVSLSTEPDMDICPDYWTRDTKAVNIVATGETKIACHSGDR